MVVKHITKEAQHECFYFNCLFLVFLLLKLENWKKCSKYKREADFVGFASKLQGKCGKLTRTILCRRLFSSLSFLLCMRLFKFIIKLKYALSDWSQTPTTFIQLEISIQKNFNNEKPKFIQTLIFITHINN